MNSSVLICSLALMFPPAAAPAGQLPADMRVDLPRDVRLVLFGVPSIQEARTAEQALLKGIDAYEEAEQAKAGHAALEQARGRVCYRLGRFDQTLATLLSKLREMEHFNGLEHYRELARELAVQAESLAAYCGDSAEPMVDEGDAAEGDAAEQRPPASGDPMKQLRAHVAEIDRTLEQIEIAARPDAERKAQLDKELGGVGQFALQLKAFVDQIKNAPIEGREMVIDPSELIQGVQGLIDTLRERKRQRELRQLEGAPESDQSRLRYRRRYLE
jgi:hypothetical protein